MTSADRMTQDRARVLRKIREAPDPDLVRLTIPEAAALLGKSRAASRVELLARDEQLGQGAILTYEVRPNKSKGRWYTTPRALRVARALDVGDVTVLGDLETRVAALEKGQRQIKAVLVVHRDRLAELGDRR